MSMYNVKVEYVVECQDIEWYTIEADNVKEAKEKAISRLHNEEDDFIKVTQIKNIEVTEKPYDKYYYVSTNIINIDEMSCLHWFDFYIAKRHSTSDDIFRTKVHNEIILRADIYAKKHHISNYKLGTSEIEEVSNEEYSYSLSCTI